MNDYINNCHVESFVWNIFNVSNRDGMIIIEVGDSEVPSSFPSSDINYQIVLLLISNTVCTPHLSDLEGNCRSSRVPSPHNRQNDLKPN